MPERERGLLAARVVVAVADEQALVVAHGVVDAGEALRARERSLVVAARERRRQLGRRVDVAEQQRGDRVAVLLARIPGLEDAGDARRATA